MNILVINCGSSSLKYQLINSDTEAVLAKGLCERIGIEGSQITYQPAGGEKEVTVSPMPTHTQAIQMVLDLSVSYTHLDVYKRQVQDVEEKTDLELFREFYELQNNRPMMKQQEKFAKKLIREIKE